MIVMGLDISSLSTGVAVYDSANPGNVITLNPSPKAKLTPWQRSLEQYKVFGTLCDVTEPVCAFIEDYAHGARGRTTTLVEVGTLYRFALHEHEIPFTTINPTSLKKFVADSGRADKKEMAVSVKARWGFQNECDDVVDAYALARVGHIALQCHFGEDVELSKREREVIETIDIPPLVG